MSMTRRIIMPLLSTLAALVIIAHTAEEDFEPDYRDYRPRLVDTGTTNYEQQAWRTMDVEPMHHLKSNNGDPWHRDSQDEPYRRRRPGRKRKRRPELFSTEDVQHERYVYQEENKPYQENFDLNSEMPKRRRKKNGNREVSEPNRPVRWSEEHPEGYRRNVRKRGQKRKQASIETWPELSEFGGQQQEQYESKDDRGDTNLNVNYEIDEDINKEMTSGFENSSTDITLIEDTTQISLEINGRYKENEDNPLSEFTLERMKQIVDSSDANTEIQDKIKDKSIKESDKTKTSKSKASLDPLTLKAILKRSNGRSLSEILQQNNLSLSDLLNGKENALSILKMEDSTESLEFSKSRLISDSKNLDIEENIRSKTDKSNIIKNEEISEKKIMTQKKNIKVHEDIVENSNARSLDNINNQEEITHNKNVESFNKDEIEISKPEEITTKTTLKIRFPVVRRKLRVRPSINNSYKSQLSRDLITISSLKYQNNRNTSKYKDWRKIVPPVINTDKLKAEISTKNIEDFDIETTTVPDETSTFNVEDEVNENVDPYTENVLEITNAVNENDDTETLNTADSKSGITDTDCINKEERTTTDVETEAVIRVTEKPKPIIAFRNSLNASTLRRQAFNNRLKRKRMKQLTSTETSQDDIMKKITNVDDSEPVSEFIDQTKTTNSEDFTTLEDFMTTEATAQTTRKKNYRKAFPNTTPKVLSTSEVTAKIEIQEILNDTLSSERLSKILKERNMTLNELVEQRERGSSHIHLADIFHNTSKEPNPPEPFLTKSLIEPISKETYPLRALLDANQHDPKATTIDSILIQSNYLNKPIVMDFGNNVNENGENMGIISLFENYTKSSTEAKTASILRNETIETQTIPNVNNDNNKKETRDSRALDSEKSLVTWNEIITFIQKNQPNESSEITPEYKNDTPASDLISNLKISQSAEEDTFGVFEDLQHLSKSFDHAVTSSGENIKVKLHESTKKPHFLDIFDTASSNTKSVTVATAGIIGLSLVLFLLTYSILKWRQQRKLFQNKSPNVDDVPPPVFENRKGLKTNSSTRSKSPMLSPSNIYTIDSLDTHKGCDSPEYMWDSLRKPFQ